MGSIRARLECGGQTTLFYDGGYPLCRREVGHYQRLDMAKRIRWINIHTEPLVLERLGIRQEEGMRRLHALTADGQLVTGAHAFAIIWSELPYYRRIGHLVKCLRILELLDRAYELFARWRFRRRLKGRATDHTETGNSGDR
jgi:predicted DCC family thiol-disulfide oxidoreductase YuxK